MAWQGKASVVVPGLGSTLHSDYLWLQIPVAWLCWNQSLDTEQAVGDELGGGQGGLCSFPACNNEAVISVSPGGGLAGETVKRGLSSTVITRAAISFPSCSTFQCWLSLKELPELGEEAWVDLSCKSGVWGTVQTLNAPHHKKTTSF